MKRQWRERGRRGGVEYEGRSRSNINTILSNSPSHKVKGDWKIESQSSPSASLNCNLILLKCVLIALDIKVDLHDSNSAHAMPFHT